MCIYLYTDYISHIYVHNLYTSFIQLIILIKFVYLNPNMFYLQIHG